MSNELSLQTLSQQLSRIVEQAAPGVVAVHGGHRAATAGFLWNETTVIAAAHALHREDGLEVTTADGRRVPATLAGSDQSSDVAVLKVEPSGSALPRTHEVKTGDLVVLVGRSAEFGPSAALGMVSLTGSPWRTWRGAMLERIIKLDAGFYFGTSGSAVLNTQGQVLGMATAGLTRGAGVAIATETLERVVEQILSKGHVARGYIGVTLQPVPSPKGLIVLGTEPDAPAAKAGLLVGDILTGTDSDPIEDTEDLQRALSGAGIGGNLTLHVHRGGQQIEVPVVVGERPRERH